MKVTFINNGEGGWEGVCMSVILYVCTYGYPYVWVLPTCVGEEVDDCFIPFSYELKKFGSSVQPKRKMID